MKLIVFLKDKSEIVIHDGKHFLTQWYNGKKQILLTKRKHKNKTLARESIKDFIQARYYEMFKRSFVRVKLAY